MGEGNKMIIIGSFVSPDLPTACLISVKVESEALVSTGNFRVQSVYYRGPELRTCTCTGHVT